VKHCKDYYLFFFDKIDDFVWKPFDDVFSGSFVFNRMDFRVSLDEVDPRINLQEKVISQAYPVVLIPEKDLALSHLQLRALQ